MEPWKQCLLSLIANTCNLTADVVAGYAPDKPLIGPDSPLGLDSIDAIEIGSAIQEQYGIRITDRNVFRSLDTLAEHLSSYVDLN